MSSDHNKKEKPLENNLETTAHGPQGVDKAPGEETAQDTVPFTQQSQKGKKVDADVTQESDRPIDQHLD